MKNNFNKKWWHVPLCAVGLHKPVFNGMKISGGVVRVKWLCERCPKAWQEVRH